MGSYGPRGGLNRPAHHPIRQEVRLGHCNGPPPGTSGGEAYPGNEMRTTHRSFASSRICFTVAHPSRTRRYDSSTTVSMLMSIAFSSASCGVDGPSLKMSICTLPSLVNLENCGLR